MSADPTFERYLDAPLPTEAEEIWRYSRIDELDLHRFEFDAGAVADDGASAAKVGAFCDAVGAAADVAVRTAKPGELEPLEVDDFFVAMNADLATAPRVVEVAAGAVIDDPIVLVHWVGTNGAAVFPRTVVRAGEQSQFTVIEYVASPDDISALVVPVTQLEIGPAANVGHLAVQDLSTAAWQLAYTRSSVERDGFLESTAVALGGDYARLRTDAKVVGQGATSNLLAVYFGTGKQMHDFRTLQDHEAPRTTSDLLFKGAVGGDSNSVYTGLIRVRPGAHGTNAFQTNRNLVLTEGAHAESVPNLEIEENDVRCSHASAIGPVDEEQRYYLETRGIPGPVADRLIVLGFFDEIIDRTPAVGLRPLLRQAVALKLQAAGV